MKSIVGFLIALLVGIVIGYSLKKAPVSEKSNDMSEVSQECTSEVDSLEALQQLESAEQRNAEANKVLSDILKLFLADVALRLSESNKKQLSSMLPPPKCVQTANSWGSGAQKNSNSAESKDSQQEQQQVIQMQKVVQIERQAKDLRNPEEEKDFIDGTQIDNVFPYMKNTASLPGNTIKQIEGVFIGQVQVNDEKNSVWEMEYKMENTTKKSDKWQADTSLILKKNGEVFSRSTGNGDLNENHKKFSGDSRAIVIESGGGSLVFQLYLISNNQRMIGTVYQKKSVDQYLPYGTVRLTRK